MNTKFFEDYLKQRGIKIKTLAEPLGVQPQTAYNIVAGRQKLNMDKAVKIKVNLRMTDIEFKEAFGDEDWYAYYEAAIR